MPFEREVLREHLHRARYAIARHATQLDEIVRARNRDDQSSVVAQHAAELGWIESRGDRQDGCERRVCVRQKTIGIRDDPVTRRIALRCCIDRGNGDVDAVPFVGFEVAEVVALAASGIEQRACERLRERDDRVEDRLCESAIEEPPPRRDRIGGIARHTRTPVLRLQQIEVAAARDVEGVPALADRAACVERERRVAVTDSTEEGR